MLVYNLIQHAELHLCLKFLGRFVIAVQFIYFPEAKGMRGIKVKK